ncbi:Hypothetical_protein [Hexamita inflata]|uniref:Hypothetical_protein n=1 Tax=Hexamita inflata TaxID=28002 RepID=A0AA86NJM6_9EUKA|nr:Hypothetical protein HINF_LOCUS8907 [Hexamita inflata]CAI9967469.1 Hypothetical protein HINF_LOCUS55114 [Hexamita inflata]
MSRRATPPTQSPVESFSDNEKTILELALRSIRYEGKNTIKQCMLCDAEGKYHELQSPNVRQVVHHLLLHNIHREQMGVQIKEFFETAKQQALIQNKYRGGNNNDQLINQLINAMEQVSQSNQCIGMSTEITALVPNISYIYIFIWQLARFKMPNLLESSTCHEISALPSRKPGKLEALITATYQLSLKIENKNMDYIKI